jgi:hypothetical protein
MTRKALAVLIGAAFLSIAGNASARSVFLNGIDVSSARNQTLKNVQIKINENGDVFIIAPHYQVNEEETYTPLSRYVQGSSGPVHVVPRAEVEPSVEIKGAASAVTTPAGTPPGLPATNGTDQVSGQGSANPTMEKAGTKTGP